MRAVLVGQHGQQDCISQQTSLVCPTLYLIGSNPDIVRCTVKSDKTIHNSVKGFTQRPMKQCWLIQVSHSRPKATA